eukprot:scaffold49071_cov54-Attheya_sp.AAC.5
MANPFGGFVHTSPLGPHKPDPELALASNAVRDCFGATVQTVADGLAGFGTDGATVPQLLGRIRTHCRRVRHEERDRLVASLADPHLRTNPTRGPEQAGYVVDTAPIRAALLVLIQHSLVHIQITHPNNSTNSNSSTNSAVTYKYSLDARRACMLPRYPRFAEYARKALATATATATATPSSTKDDPGDMPSAIVEELLIHGRMRTADLVRDTLKTLAKKENAEEDSTAATTTKEDDTVNSTPTAATPNIDTSSSSSSNDKSADGTLSKAMVENLKRLVEQGFLELVPPLAGSNLEEDGDEGETEFEGDNVGKKRKRNDGNVNVDVDDVGADDPAIVELLRNHRKVFPPGAVWRVNVSLFHANLRAFALGRLVAERYRDKVPTAGSLVSAALKLVAHREHALDASSALSEEDKHQRIQDRTIFAPDDLLAFLPAPIVKDYQGMAGGARANLSASLVKLSQHCTWPQVIIEVEDAIGHPLGGKFEVSTRQLVDHLQGRILNQVIEDSQGQVAARICSILQSKGQLESDAVAEAAMVPAKDVREVLHRLFQQNYIVLLTLQQTKQHNPSNAIYLWSIHKARMFQSVLHNVCQALQNIRLRRQHEMEVGREWIERAKEASYLDENEHENDKANYLKFCQGLERLDCATLQLDETLMVLRDF